MEKLNPREILKENPFPRKRRHYQVVQENDKNLTSIYEEKKFYYLQYIQSELFRKMSFKC